VPAPGARLTLTSSEFMHRAHWFVENAVVEISEPEPRALGAPRSGGS
jgi:hypothetical protein